MPQLLITNATIHSSRHPFATALLVDNGVVAWVGDTEVARSIAPNATVRDAEGALSRQRLWTLTCMCWKQQSRCGHRNYPPGLG